MQNTWVSSAGGPLLVAPQSALPLLWTGASSTDGPVESWGDCGRACAVDGYIGTVTIGQRQALVLGDEPATTTYLPAQRLFLRWAAADEEDELVSVARRAAQDGVAWDAEEDLRWVVDGPVVLFDSAWPGTELEPDNHLVIDPHPGTNRVRCWASFLSPMIGAVDVSGVADDGLILFVLSAVVVGVVTVPGSGESCRRT